ncbi:MAG TPA: PAS domain-containing protein [Burkholderiales bacterium]|nr:PAS domain-containing protein [Burkholderiales bacterium]
MNTGQTPEWLLTTVTAVRDLMIKRLEAESLNEDAKREMEMALEELDVMWEELQGQAALLIRENERYAEFFEYAPDAYLITDAGGNVREANQAALDLLKAPRDAVVGKSLTEYIAIGDRVTFLTRTVGLMVGATARSLAWQALIQPAEGDVVTAQFSVRAIPLKKSGVGGLCWLIRPAA